MKPLQYIPTFPAFSPPSSRLVFSTTPTYSLERALPPVGSMLSLFIPCADAESAANHATHLNLHQKRQDQCNFELPISLANLIHPSFITDYIRNTSRHVLIQSRGCLDFDDDILTLLPSGLLVLCLSKTTYETMGLPGTPVKNALPKSCKGAANPLTVQRWIVKVDLAADRLIKPGDTLYQRLQWISEHTLIAPFPCLFSSTDLLTGLSVPPPTGFAPATQRPLSPISETLPSVSIPDFAAFIASPPLSASNPIALELLFDLNEYIGLLALSSPLIDPIQSARTDPYIATYTLPDIPIISTHTSMLKITLKGLLPSRIASQFITSILQSTTAPFVLVSVHGIPECTVSAVKKSKLAYRLSVDGDATVTSIAISKDSMAVWRCGSQLDGHE